MRSRALIVVVSTLFALCTLAPYLAGYGLAGTDRFMGFLFNPLDAASYLAKMRQGWDGQWLYTLAFTENPGPGGLIFPWYLFLGHLARILDLPLIVIWQIIRVCGCAGFLYVAWEFLGRLGFTDRVRILAWVVTAFGSGFGWLALPLGVLGSDLWVSEYIPLYGMLTSAHFPLAMSLILLLVMRIALPGSNSRLLSLLTTSLLGFALGAIQPFAILPVGLALTIWILLRRMITGRFPEGTVAGLAVAGLGVLPWAAYDLWIVRASPQLASWFAQNQTPSAPAWDIALSLGLPGLICASAMMRWVLAPGKLADKIRSTSPETLLLGLWLIINLALLFSPLSLQRRLMLGMWIPLAALAAPRLEAWIFHSTFPRLRTLSAAALLVPSSLFFILALVSGVVKHNPLLYLSRDEAAAADWFSANVEPDSVVLASPEISAWLPGTAGVRVIYGHPMETPFADRAHETVERFFSGQECACMLSDRHVNYILVGPREKNIGVIPASVATYPPVYFDTVTLYLVP